MLPPSLFLSLILHPPCRVWKQTFRLSMIAGSGRVAWDWKLSHRDWRSLFGWTLLWRVQSYCPDLPFFLWELHVLLWIQWSLGASWVRCFRVTDFSSFSNWVLFRWACYWIGSRWWLPCGCYLPHRTVWRDTNRSFPIGTVVLFARIWGVWCLVRWTRWGWVGWSVVRMRLWRNQGCIYRCLWPNLLLVSTFRGSACWRRYVVSR